jgi:capsular polysaccharide biosynthesis protein
MAAVEQGQTIVVGPATDGDFTINRAVALLRRHARLATVVFGVVLASAATFATSVPDIYRSTATVLVEHPGTTVVEQRGTTAGVGKSLIASDLETRLQTISQEVLSHARLIALMDRFDLYPELRMRGGDAVAVARLRRDIQVKLNKGELGARQPATVAFSIVFLFGHPETAARVANALASLYVQENAKILERQAIAARLPRLTQELAQMQEVYTSQYPDVVRLKAEIAALKRLPRASSAVGEEFRVLDPAIPARSPVAPERIRFILLGIVLGLGTAAGAVIVANKLDGSFHTRESRADRSRWMTAAAIALSLVLVVFVSYHLASDNDQLALSFPRNTR